MRIKSYSGRHAYLRPYFPIMRNLGVSCNSYFHCLVSLRLMHEKQEALGYLARGLDVTGHEHHNQYTFHHFPHHIQFECTDDPLGT